MKKMMLDDFIRYAKEQFDCGISVKKCNNPDTFASIFGTSFLNDDNSEEIIDEFKSDISYENISIDVQFVIEDEMGDIYNSNVELAA